MFMLCSTASPIALQIRGATEFCSKPHQDDVVFFGWAIHTIRCGMEERFHLRRKTCPKTGSEDCSRGIATGAQRPQSEQSKTIRCSRSMVRARIFGQTNTPTSM